MLNMKIQKMQRKPSKIIMVYLVLNFSILKEAEVEGIPMKVEYSKVKVSNPRKISRDRKFNRRRNSDKNYKRGKMIFRTRKRLGIRKGKGKSILISNK